MELIQNIGQALARWGQQLQQTFIEKQRYMLLGRVTSMERAATMISSTSSA